MAFSSAINFNLSFSLKNYPVRKNPSRGKLLYGCSHEDGAFSFCAECSAALSVLAERYFPRRDLLRKASVMFDKQERRLKFQQQLLDLHSRDHVDKIHRLVP